MEIDQQPHAGRSVVSCNSATALVDRHDVLNGLELNEQTVVDHDIHGVGLILEQKETKETKGIGKVGCQPVRSSRESDSTDLSRAATNIIDNYINKLYSIRR